MIQGIDSSNLAGNTRADWVAAKGAGNSFAVLRADFGTWVDTDFARHWEPIKRAGLIRGAYLLLRWDQDPEQEAITFANAVGPLGPGDLPPAIDVEFGKKGRKGTGLTPKQVLERVRIAEHTLHARYGTWSMCYTSARSYAEDLNNIPADGLTEMPLWLARYVPGDPPVPPPWGAGNWWFHQFEGDVKLAGFSGVVDVNHFNLMTASTSGARVTWVQKRLAKFLAEPAAPVLEKPLKVDGDFGRITYQAVRAFQASRGLAVDGVIGVSTFSHLAWIDPSA